MNKNLNYNLLPRSDAADHSSFINVQKRQRDINVQKVYPSISQTVISRNAASPILIPRKCTSILSCHGQRMARQVGSIN